MDKPIHLQPHQRRRIPRFVEEYAKDRNGTRAAIRAGYSPSRAGATACILLQDPEVRQMVQDACDAVSRECRVDAEMILKEWVDIATADPSLIVKVRRLCCRYCHGVGNNYQWSAREYAEACDSANANQVLPPDCSGGFGWVHNLDPNPDCPECAGEGLENVFVCDTEALTGPERKLIQSVKQTKEGIEIKMRDQDAAVKHLAQYVGMLVERREVSTTAGPIPTELPTDPKALAALYEQFKG